jgi:hypothetical protein
MLMLMLILPLLLHVCARALTEEACVACARADLSTPLFAEIEADMNEAELEIAKSTPSFQLIPGQDPVLAA